MFRLRLIGTKAIFLSPFVYTKLQAEQKVRTHKWVVAKKCVLQMVKVTSWPQKAVWAEEHEEKLFGTALDNKIRGLEIDWRTHDWTQACVEDTFTKGDM